MTDFHDVDFPLTLSFGARGGPVRRTDITQLANGGEHRSSPHTGSRRRYDAGAGIKSLYDIHALIAFFEARSGQQYAFRFRDPMDHRSGLPAATLSASDQQIGVGDGAETQFQLVKAYADAGGEYVRAITKPVSGTVLAAVNGQTEAVSVDALTGRITFAAPPVNGALITAGFQFDVPVRFGTDHLDISLESFGAGKAESIPLIEVIDHA